MRHDDRVKGIILNLLERVTVDAHGEQLWDELLDQTGLTGAYTALGNYEDAEVLALVAGLGELTGQDQPTLLRWFGREAIVPLRERYPAFFAPPDPVSFVLTLHDVIHSEVRKLYEGATPPVLTFHDVSQDTVTIEYRSARAMTDLAIGFLEGTAAHYGVTVEVRRTLLEPDGTHALLACTFGSPG